MKPLTKTEKAELKKFIDAGEALPESWLSRLFSGRVAAAGTQHAIGKEYPSWQSSLMQELLTNEPSLNPYGRVP